MPLALADHKPAAVGFIGAGQMGGAMLRGLARTKTVAGEHLVAYDTVADRLAELCSDIPGFTPCRSNGIVYQSSDIVVLAVEPKDIPSVCYEICNAPAASEKKRIVVSLAAGVTLSTLASSLPPELPIVRVMPNTPCTVGAQAAGYCCNGTCTVEDAALVSAMLGALGSALRVEDEDDLDAVTGVSGSGPAYVFQFIEAMSDGGVRCGLSRHVATTLAAQTVMGAGKMVLETKMHPGALKDMVTSPGGTTIAAVHALEAGGMRAAVINAVVASTERSRELGGKTAAHPGNADGAATGRKRARRDA